MLPYTLPETFDPNSYTITLTLVSKPKWLDFDEKTNQFSVVVGRTIVNDVGTYIIKIKLSNSGGGSATYSL